MEMTSKMKNEDNLKNEDDLENVDHLENEDNLKNEDDLKNEDQSKNGYDLKNEEDLKSEDDLKKKSILFFCLHPVGLGYALTTAAVRPIFFSNSYSMRNIGDQGTEKNSRPLKSLPCGQSDGTQTVL